jgi:hypothetical protein
MLPGGRPAGVSGAEHALATGHAAARAEAVPAPVALPSERASKDPGSHVDVAEGNRLTALRTQRRSQSDRGAKGHVRRDPTTSPTSAAAQRALVAPRRDRAPVLNRTGRSVTSDFPWVPGDQRIRPTAQTLYRNWRVRTVSGWCTERARTGSSPAASSRPAGLIRGQRSD